jgi:lysophospholipase L1-like esterase
MSLRIASRALAGLLTVACAIAVSPPLAAQGKDKKKSNPAAKSIERKDERSVKRHKAILASVKKGDAQLVFMGDSITEGWLSTGRSLWKARYEPLKAANLGVVGDSTSHLLWRITKGGEMKGLKPKLVVLMIGINNVTNGHKPEQIAEGVAALIKAIQDNHAATKVLLVSTFPAGKAPAHKFRAPVKALNALLARQADGDRVRFLDVHGKFLDAKGNLTGAIGSDGIHLTGKGYQVWADAIQPTIDSVVGKPAAPPSPPGKGKGAR